MTPDDVPDVAQLDGATLHLLPHADDFFIVNEMASGVDDVCLMPGAGVGGADAVAVVGASGLRRIWYDGAQNQFSSASIDSGAWAGALIVRSGDVNDDGVADLVGIASDEQTVLIQLADSTGTNFSAATGFVADADVRDLLVLPWDTDSVHEIALLTDLAVDVHDADGVQLNSFTARDAGRDLLRHRSGRPGAGTDRLDHRVRAPGAPAPGRSGARRRFRHREPGRARRLRRGPHGHGSGR